MDIIITYNVNEKLKTKGVEGKPPLFKFTKKYKHPNIFNGYPSMNLTETKSTRISLVHRAC